MRLSALSLIICTMATVKNMQKLVTLVNDLSMLKMIVQLNQIV